MRNKKSLTAVQISLAYVLFASLWILLSDRLIGIFASAPTTFIQAQMIKGLLFVAVTALLLFFVLKRNQEIRRKTDQALRESEEKFRLLFEKSIDPVFLLDERFFLDCNDSALAFLGASNKNQVIGKPPYLLSPENQPDGTPSKEKAQMYIEAALKEGSQRFEWVHTRLDGELLVIDVALTAVNMGGRRLLHVAWRDLTRRKQAEQAVRHSQQRLERIVETVPSGITIVNRDGRVSYANRTAEKFLGLTRSRDAGHIYDEVNWKIEAINGGIFTTKDLPFNVVIRTSQPVFGVEYAIRYPNDSRRVLRVNSAPLYDDDFNIAGVVSSIEDVTEVKLAEERLREREELYRLLFNSTPAGIFHYNRAFLITDCNEEMTRMAQADRNQMIGTDLTHLRDSSIFPVLQSAIEGKEGHFEGQYYPTYSDRKIWIWLRTAPLFDHENHVSSAVAIIEDITERKLAELRVQEHIRRLDALRQVDMAISSITELSVTMKILLKNLLELLGEKAGAVMRYDTGSAQLQYVVGLGFNRVVNDVSVPLIESPAGQVVLQRRRLIINQTEEICRLVQWFGDEICCYQQYIGFPLIAKGKLNGVLEIYQPEQVELNSEWMEILEMFARQAAIAIDSAMLYENMESTNRELMMAYDATLEGWSRALELRDRETQGHSKRVTEMTLKLAQRLGVPDNQTIHIRRGALLHDIGKLGVPDTIMQKPAALTESEWEIMVKHPMYAYEMLSPIPYLSLALEIPYCHHEKWDGSGYPRGLAGEEIPLAARIFSIVDVWDALSSDRPYRSAWSEEQVYQYLLDQSGKHFDPKVVSEFVALLEELKPG